MDVLINEKGGMLPQCICISNHQDTHFKYISYHLIYQLYLNKAERNKLNTCIHKYIKLCFREPKDSMEGLSQKLSGRQGDHAPPPLYSENSTLPVNFHVRCHLAGKKEGLFSHILKYL